MAEELIHNWDKLRLTEEEEVVIGGDFEDEDDEDSKTQISLILMGKVLTNKPFNVEAMKRILTGLWRAKENIIIRMVESNLFVFQFFCENDKERVMEGSPWFFGKKLVVLKEIKGDEQPSEVVFTNTPFWVQLEDVPFNRRNMSVAYEVGEYMGGFLKYDDSDPLGWEAEMRIKVMLEIDKPLRRGVKISTGRTTSKWVGVKYERLEDFCFFCGKLDHVEKECQRPVKNISDDDMVYQYGPYLRGSPKKRSRVSASEREKEKQLLSKLRGKKITRRPSYDDPLAVKLGPPSAARKLLFGTPKSTFKKVVSSDRGPLLMEVSTKDEEAVLVERKSIDSHPSPILKGACSSILAIEHDENVRPASKAGLTESLGVNVEEASRMKSWKSTSECLQVCASNMEGRTTKEVLLCTVIEPKNMTTVGSKVNSLVSDACLRLNEDAHVNEPINKNIAKGGKRWRRNTKRDLISQYVHDVAIGDKIGDKRNFSHANVNNSDNDSMMVECDKRQKYEFCSFSGDGLSQVEGVGLDQALEKQ